MIQNYDYTQPLPTKEDVYDGMKPYDGQHGVKEEADERYSAGIALGTPESAELRVSCLGFGGCGASSLMLKCAYNESINDDEDCNSKLLQWDHHQFQYKYEEEDVRISFCDLRGFDSAISKKQMTEMIDNTLSYSNVILLLYSIDSRSSFEGDYSVQDIKQYMDERLSVAGSKIVLLVATKCDLSSEERCVSSSEGESLGNAWEIPFFETSSKSGANMSALLDQICDIFKYDCGGNYPLNDNEEAGQEAAAAASGVTAEDRGDDADFLAQDKLTFAPHCCCCGWLENCLINHSCCSCCCGGAFYVPFMVILYVLWLIQIPITLIINLFAFALCCNFCKCQCCRGTLFIADDESVPDAHESVLLHTAESIRDLYLKSENDGHDLVPPDSPQHAPASDSEKQSISILQWNIFGQLGRYWARYPLLTTAINDMSPDILCFEEAVTSKWWRFGTINTMKRINPSYRGFHVSAYNVLHDYNKLLFQYSCGWRAINECQSCCNLYCFVPFWRDKMWQYSLRSNACCAVLFNTFSGVIAQIGNTIIFKQNYQLFRSYIPLQPGSRRFALRALYILKDETNQTQMKYGQRLSITIQKKKKKKRKRKKVWVVCTHLSANSDEVGARQCEQIIAWMDKAQKKVCKADAIIICGDFNATPQSKIYQIMCKNGYESVVKRKLKKEQWTYPTETWKYNRTPMTDDGNLIADEADEETYRRTKDYIWIKSRCPVNIDKVKLIGNQYADAQHQGEFIKIFPSDHLGIYCKLSL
eukprot:124613_1